MFYEIYFFVFNILIEILRAYQESGPNKKGSSQKVVRNTDFSQKSKGYVENVAMFAFSDAILLRHVRACSLMENVIGYAKVL